jgi:hypothetical protein
VDTTDTDIQFVGSKSPTTKYVHFKTDTNTYATFVSYCIRHSISRGEALGRLLVIADNSGDFPKEKKRKYY